MAPSSAPPLAGDGGCLAEGHRYWPLPWGPTAAWIAAWQGGHGRPVVVREVSPGHPEERGADGAKLGVERRLELWPDPLAAELAYPAP